MSIVDTNDLAQYLTFTLDREVYAINVSSVKEVLEYTDITKVPRTPAFMRGVINVRGSVVPVIDLRLKFDMSKTENTIETCIIVMELTIDNEKTILGALADSVKEVIELPPNQIEPPPKIGTKMNTAFIEGMGKQDDQFIIILDVNKVFSSEELSLVQDKIAEPVEA